MLGRAEPPRIGATPPRLQTPDSPLPTPRSHPRLRTRSDFGVLGGRTRERGRRSASKERGADCGIDRAVRRTPVSEREAFKLTDAKLYRTVYPHRRGSSPAARRCSGAGEVEN